MQNFALMTRPAMANTAVSVLDISGVLDINTVGDFEAKLEECFKNNQFKIVLNMEKLTYISSAGIGVMVGNIKNVRKNKGDIKVAGVNEELYKVFDLMELPGLFHFLKTERDAVAEF